MNKTKLSLQPSEGIVAQAAAGIYAAYIIAGRVAEGDERKWMERSLREAFQIAKIADESIQSDSELS